MDILALLLAVIVVTFIIQVICDNDSNNGINHSNMKLSNSTRKSNSNSNRNRNSSNNNGDHDGSTTSTSKSSSIKPNTT